MIDIPTILNYGDDELLAFVDRRVGGDNHSAQWDINNRIDIFGTKAKSGGVKKDAFGGVGGGSGFSKTRLRTAISAKHGQAVVKVISYGRGKDSARNQLNYISRRGDLKLEDRDGCIIEGGEAVEELAKDWIVDFDTKANSRNLVHIVLSAPKDTDREAQYASVRDFTQSVFAHNYDFVFVRHDDTDNPHTHLLVKMRGDDGKKLDPRKADLRAWREEYARCALKYGIKLDASSRRSRGQGVKGRRMAVIKLQERGDVSHAEKATAREVFKKPNALHPAEEAAKKGFEAERREFAKLGLALKALTGRDDEVGSRARALLVHVHNHATSITAPKGMRAEFRDILRESGASSVEALIKSRSKAKSLSAHDPDPHKKGHGHDLER